MTRKLLHISGSSALAIVAALIALWALHAAQTVNAAPSGTARVYPSAECNTTLQACINLSADGDSITISAGIYVTSVTLNKAVSLIGVLSSTTILKALPNQRIITVSGVTVTGGVRIANLTLAEGNAAGQGGAMHILNNAAPLLSNLVFTRNTAIGVGAGGGGLYMQSALPITLVNVIFISNTSANSGGAIRAFGDLRIIGGRFERNRCANSDCRGGAIRADGGAQIEITGTVVFTANSAQDMGGAIYAGDFVNVNAPIFGAIRFDNNSAMVSTTPNGGGGAIFAEAGVLLTNTRLNNNYTLGDGGALLVTNTGEVRLHNVEMGDNLAARRGGAAALLGSNLRVSLSRVFGDFNSASHGGVFMLGAGVSATLGTSNFQYNETFVGSGGVISNLGQLTLFSPDIFAFPLVFGDNRAQANGGAIASAGSLRILKSTNGAARFASNTALLRGGAIHSADSTALSIERAQFLTNTATAGGGAIHMQGDGWLTDTVFTVNAAPFGNGGGILADGMLDLRNAQMTGNSAVSGGAIQSSALMDGTATPNLIIQSSSFTFNSALTTTGGAVNSLQSTSIEDTTFVSNTAQTEGGAVRVGANLWVTRAQFIGNLSLSAHGGALTHSSGDARIVNALFARNAVRASVPPGQLAVISLISPGQSAVLHTTIVSPTRSANTAIVVGVGQVGVTNTIIMSHTNGILKVSGSGVFEDYNLFAGNIQNLNSIVTPIVSGGHSFTGAGRFRNQAADDYHLLAGSAAIDRGANVGVTSDYDNNGRPLNAAPDIGYDETPALLYLPIILR